MDKKVVIEELRKSLEHSLKETERNIASSIRHANEAPSFMQSASDTDKMQYSRLAEQQQSQKVALEQGLENLAKAKLFVLKSGAGKELCYLRTPCGGGLTLKIGKKEVKTLSEESPLGQKLSDLLSIGDAVSISNTEMEIVSVD